MLRIGLLSDTHSFLDTAVFHHFDKVDEVWHAGDFGNAQRMIGLVVDHDVALRPDAARERA